LDISRLKTRALLLANSLATKSKPRLAHHYFSTILLGITIMSDDGDMIPDHGDQDEDMEEMGVAPPHEEVSEEEEDDDDDMHDEASTTAPPEPVEVDAAIARRRAIQAIMRDTTISGQDKAHRIQSLMSGGRTEVAPPPAPVIPMSDAGTGSAACVHYERNCNIVAPCCNRIYGCRICHDELSPPGHPPLDRFLIREVICKNCNTRQAATNQCVDCQTVFGEYHCGTCNLWMSTVCYYFVVVVAFRYWWFNYSPAV
jgi:uncharacterized CHY-type Zn-finger protein